jgi:hypothetical protein
MGYREQTFPQKRTFRANRGDIDNSWLKNKIGRGIVGHRIGALSDCLS